MSTCLPWKIAFTVVRSWRERRLGGGNVVCIRWRKSVVSASSRSGAFASFTMIDRANLRMRLSSSEVRRFARPWTWRVRAILPGQGAGQWSESRPFTPSGR